MKIFSNPSWLIAACLVIFAACGSRQNQQQAPEPEAIAPVYTRERIVFSLSWLSNIGSGFDTTSVAALQAFVGKTVNTVVADTAVQRLIGKWNVVWGPIVYSDNSNVADSVVADNTMMLLQRQGNFDAPDYVIAIAGTNSVSPFGWFSEDFNVKDMMQWPARPAGNNNNFSSFINPAVVNPTLYQTEKCISMGTATGINILLNTMKDKGLTLAAYLAKTVGNGSNALEVAVAGHSLGGALAPTLALSLADNQPSWNPSGKVTVSAYPTAGATPGNALFARYTHATLAKNYHAVWNSMDIVPHAWMDSTMSLMPALYSNNQNIGTPCFINKLITCVGGQSQGHYYTRPQGETTFAYPYKNINVDSICSNMTAQKRLQLVGLLNLNGCYNAPVLNCNLLLDGANFSRTLRYLNEAGYQHITAYENHFQIGNFVTITRKYAHHPTPSELDKLMTAIRNNPLIKSCVKF